MNYRNFNFIYIKITYQVRLKVEWLTFLLFLFMFFSSCCFIKIQCLYSLLKVGFEKEFSILVKKDNCILFFFSFSFTKGVISSSIKALFLDLYTCGAWENICSTKEWTMNTGQLYARKALNLACSALSWPLSSQSSIS